MPHFGRFAPCRVRVERTAVQRDVRGAGGSSNRRFERRFCPLLPLLAKVGRAEARNISVPRTDAQNPHSSLYPWLRIKFTLSRQFSLTFTHVSMYTLVPMNFSMSRRAWELMRLSISPPLPMMMPLWLAFSQ